MAMPGDMVTNHTLSPTQFLPRAAAIEPDVRDYYLEYFSVVIAEFHTRLLRSTTSTSTTKSSVGRMRLSRVEPLVWRIT